MVESSSPYRTVVPQAAYFLLGIFSCLVAEHRLYTIGPEGSSGMELPLGTVRAADARRTPKSGEFHQSRLAMAPP